jgi:hypothetical protein
MPGDATPDPQEIAETIRRALVNVAIRAYEDAGLSGLCEEGRWEIAIGAMRSYDLQKLPMLGRVTDS